ncbi:unnamed protein product [Clonostachys rosea f. rosea IK726]|uniref:Uncharacterized protein n=1 Tax=Clonostachys rosea f. rosea IK726 TaxID=1349383 RepID=A0ACA9URD8_BIOOC|nr:unnamed protein product [Clonostachys rosea f. rosea IK726]
MFQIGLHREPPPRQIARPTRYFIRIRADKQTSHGLSTATATATATVPSPAQVACFPDKLLGAACPIHPLPRPIKNHPSAASDVC